jgi:hypothetical protein
VPDEHGNPELWLAVCSAHQFQRKPMRRIPLGADGQRVSWKFPPGEDDDTVPGYFTAKAREIFMKAGGNPDNAGGLAEWAQSARAANNTRGGVIVGEDGTILAETVYHQGAGASYVTDADTHRWNLFGNEVGLAIGQIARQTGQRVIHIKYSVACQGAGRFITDHKPGNV